jgi:FdhD protein
MKAGIHHVSYIQVTSDRWETIQSASIVEKPVSLTVNGEIWLIFMCTPVDLDALAAGFLFNEGLIESKHDIADLRVCPTDENIDVWLNLPIQKPEIWRRTSGCTGGMTGRSEALGAALSKLSCSNGYVITSDQINRLVGQLYETQPLYQQSGGVHTSALSDGEALIVWAEDVGRHNTLDKIAGKILLQSLTIPHPLVLTTGRISSEMLQKASRLGAPIVISRTAPTSLSIQLAEKGGITLIGYARRDRFNVYTHPQRILPSPTIVNVKENHAQTNLQTD